MKNTIIATTLFAGLMAAAVGVLAHVNNVANEVCYGPAMPEAPICRLAEAPAAPLMLLSI